MMIFLNVVYNLPLAISGLFSALRVFALLDHAYFTAGCVLLLGLAPMGIALYVDCHMVFLYVDDAVLGSSCYFLSILLPAPVLFSLASILTVIAPDIIAIVATWRKTYRQVRQAASIGVCAGFSETLIQYGTLYFGVILLVNMVSLAVFLIHSGSRFTNGISVFVAILPNILISRFIINLRQVESLASGSRSRLCSMSAPRFRVPSIPEMIGNLGEPLSNGDEAHEVRHTESCAECCNELHNRDNDGDRVSRTAEGDSSSGDMLKMQREMV
ncbi:hypothetical protein NM688_g3993 [Phlebia brevispora]|uniref:Uncharacterized protein n=1 Tax=Phlebia brevispora TaxID=194682 RepID=A0ACC1T3X2_9APHY|nr:hypothetical protein NM688_g3993 [Phlebia brevispora]